MPKIKINAAHNLDPSLGLPWWAERHVLTLCDRHITNETWKKIANDALPPCGGSLFVMAEHLVGQAYDDYVVYFDDETDISDLPQDLKECVMFAAAWGYNALQFEPEEPENMEPISQLKTYR
ncbi:MAG: hypothetical protein HDQ88_08710 [Clostridia bacterium]|nr:hypothetical protein [Clostridia bacterium]